MPFDTSDAQAKDDALCAAIGDMTPAMEASVLVVADGIEANFRSESSAGDPWEQLAASTVAERMRKGYGPAHPILNRESVLKNVASAHRVANASGAEVGSDDSIPYARAQADGYGNIPARDFLAQTSLTIDAIDRAIQDHLERNDG